MTHKVLHWLKHVVLLILLLAAYLTNSFLLEVATATAHSAPSLAMRFIGLTLMSAAGLLALFTWYYRRQLQAENPRNFGKTPVRFNSILIVMTTFIALLAVQFLWMLLIVNHILPTPDNQAAVEAATNQLPFWNNAYDVFLAPVFEEFIFRGFFFNFFFVKNRPRDTWLGILVSGLIFGYMHTLSLSPTMLFYSALGCLMAWTYLHFKDIRYSIALHFLNNLWAIL